MCLPPVSHAPASRGKSPPSSSSSSASGSSSDAPLPSPRKSRRGGSNSASTEGDLPSRIVLSHGRPHPSQLRSSAPPSRKPSTRKSSRTSSVAGNGSITGLAPTRKSSTRGARDPTRLAPGSPRIDPRSPTFSTRSEKPARSPSKKQHSATVDRSSSRRKRSEASSTQIAATPRTPAAEKKEKKKLTSKMDGRDQIISMRAPLQGGGMVSGLVVIQQGSSRRGSESGSSRSKSSSRRSESQDGKRERPGSNSSSKATTLAADPVGLGISLENSRTPTPTSRTKVERVKEIDAKQLQIPKISIDAPSPENQKPVPKPPIVTPKPASAPAPKPPVISVSPPKATPAYPIMATLVYPTKEELAYQPISRYQVTSNNSPTKTNIIPPHPPKIVRTAPALATHAVPTLSSIPVTARLPPSMLQYHNPFDTSPNSSVHEIPLGGGGTPSLSQKSSVSSLASTSTSSSAVSASAISIKEPEEPRPIVRQISYVVNAVVSPTSSTSSLVSALSASSSSTNQSFQSAAPRTPTPDVTVPELSGRKPNYYRYTATQNVIPRPMKAIMDSPRPPTTARRAGPWDGMPGADPNLGAYYRNAAAAKLREAAKPAAPKPEADKPKDTPIDEANLAAYYHQAEVQKRKLALEKMKHEQSETEDETSASEVSGASKSWVDPNLAGYYRAEAAKRKKEQEEITKATLNPEKALTVSPTKELPTGVVAGRKVFFSGLRRAMPQVFHHAPPPPPAPTPPPGGDATSAVGEEGPPEGAAESWFKASMAAGSGEDKPAEYWSTPSESTLPGAGAEESEFPSTAPPPAPTPPLREKLAGGQPSPRYYEKSPRTGYSYH